MHDPNTKKVLGVSGSAIPDSNTDKAVKAVLEATGCQTEFVKLSDYRIEPCRACLGCAKTNRCVINDDGVALAQKAKEADAIVIGCYTPYSTIDSRSKAFIERLYPLRHNHGFMRGKPGGAVVAHGLPEGNAMLPPSAELGANAVMFYMMEEGMNFLGAVKVLGNAPCLRCGFGDDCELSGVKMIAGPDAKVDSVAINCFDEQPETMAAARDLGIRIREALMS
jgi:multimeric flavodoxin WrbA